MNELEAEAAKDHPATIQVGRRSRNMDVRRLTHSAKAMAYGEERRIRLFRPACSEQVFAPETLPILPGENDPALELPICDCPVARADMLVMR